MNIFRNCIATVAALLAVFCCVPTVRAAELQYTETSENIDDQLLRRLLITAVDDNDAPLWRMVINLGRSDNHLLYRPGTICSFQDIQWPTPDGVPHFEYAAPISLINMYGLMRFSAISGTLNDTGGRLNEHYQFTITDSSNTALNRVLTVTIHAPDVSAAGGYQTEIDARCTVKNISGSAVDMATVGLQGLNMNLNIDGLEADIQNPLDATAKPIVHDLIPIDGHHLYLVEDWYGDKAHLFDGPMIRMTVRDCDLAAARGMRPGLAFEVAAPEMSLADVKTSGKAVGSTMVHSTYHLYAGLIPNKVKRPIANMTQLLPGDEVSMDYTGSIVAPAPPPAQPEDHPNLAIEATTSMDFVYQNALATDDQHRVALSVRIVEDESPNTEYGVTVERLEGPGQATVIDDPQGDPLLKYLVGSRRNGGLDAGLSRWRVTVTGNAGGSASAEFDLHVRLLGDVNGNGLVEPNDKSALNNRINGVITTGDFESFDINGDGLVEPADQSLLNNLLNGVPIN